MEAFKNLFKPITESDIDNYRKEYVGSELERSDLKKAYMNGGGCINYMMEHVPFMGVEDEERFHEIISAWVKSGEVPEFEQFTNESKAKKNRRHKKYARESKEAEELKKKLKEKNQQASDENDLAKQIMKRGQERGRNFDSWMDSFMNKYANAQDDDDDEVTLENLGKKMKKGKKTPARASKKETPTKGGRVSKRNK